VSTLTLALHDALDNQRRRGAVVVLTIRGGVVVEGQLKPPPGGQTYHDQATVMIDTLDGGWQTFVMVELAGVGVRPDA
jgi:hypothetical protein